jgi:hypothetical protein
MATSECDCVVSAWYLSTVCIVRVKFCNVQTVPAWDRTTGTKDSLIVDAKLGLPLMVLSEVVNNLVRIPTVAVTRLHSGSTTCR